MCSKHVITIIFAQRITLSEEYVFEMGFTVLNLHSAEMPYFTVKTKYDLYQESISALDVKLL